MHPSLATPSAAPTPALADVGAGWTEWLADNLLQGCAHHTLVSTLTQKGFALATAQEAVAAIGRDPCFRAAQKQVQLRRKLESMMANLATLQARQFDDLTVERRQGLSADEFLSRYYHGSRPVILTDLAADWPALQRWTAEYFAQAHGDAEIEVQSGRNGDPDYEINSPRHKTPMRMGQFIARITEGGAGNDLYLTANNHALKRPALRPLLNDIGSLPAFFDRQRLPDQSLLWIGGDGVITPMHHDTLQLMHTQIQGRKRWLMVSPLQTPLVANHIGVFSKLRMEAPHLGRHPLPPELRVIDLTVEPGETLFVPVGWWHHVRTIGTNVSLSFTNFALPNVFPFDDPQIRDW
jgi:hypothetical protein